MSDRASRPAWSLVPAVFVIAVVSLSVHVVMLQVLHVPYPAMAGVGRWGLLLVLVRILALMTVYRLAGWALARRRLAVQVGAVALLDTMLAGNVRSAIMAGVVTTDFAFPMIGLAADLAQSTVLALLILGSRCLARPSWTVPLAAVAVTTVMTFAIGPVGQAAVAPFDHLRRPEVHTEPYGIAVLSWSYATFVETVAGVIAVAALVAPRLLVRPVPALLQFVILILLLRGTLIMQLLFPWFMQAGFAAASLSTSQFFLQDAVMATLVWAYWTRGRPVWRRTESASATGSFQG